jgi:1,2-dihydroxy-3-keto-5-methylthiopentene dioxygenase
MTLLTVWADTDPLNALIQTSDRDVISAELAALGVAYSNHPVRDDVLPSATQDEVIAAYQPMVDALIAEHGYTLIDVAQLHTGDDAESQAIAAAARLKFLAEHTHDEEEIRFFSAGSGVFYLHMNGRVLAMLCTEGDLISVPELTTHWFDMGVKPDFTAIRFFREDDGWVGSFTGSDIASKFPTHDELTAVAVSRA